MGPNERPGIVVLNASQLQEQERLRAEALAAEQEVDDERFNSSLAGHIQQVFQDNKDARTTSGIERKLLESLRAYNGHYDPEDIQRIKQSGGSDIFMNLTPTKCRAAMSWIRDILLPARENAWQLSPTPVPDIPEDIKEKIKQELQKYIKEDKQPQPQQQPGQPPQEQKDMGDAAAKLQDVNKLESDLQEAVKDEIYKLAEREVKKFEQIIADQLAEGRWEDALSEFIEDFCVFQAAIMKGPVITRKKRLKWVNGKPEEQHDFVYLNKRVSPLDIYPSADATDIYDGNLCEHIRLTRGNLYKLIGTEGYKEDAIRSLLDVSQFKGVYSWLQTYVEEQKAEEEYRGDTYRANKDLFHGIHYFGSASWRQLFDFGYPMEGLSDDEDADFEIEAILIGDKVIKCVVNEDPLLRRPYYKACFQNIPGSWWGRSLPELMRDIQRMCNATARALSNNMGIASGPQVEVYIDRVAADEEIEDIYPWKLWQVTTDPTGASGRAVQFWQPSSHAGELLAVYKEFEIRADDATGIPRYAYGNERTGGAAQTASGLSMLLESASKGIKDAIRHIDDGLIRPRVEYQFYWNMITSENSDFTGDVVIVPQGSQSLTMRGAQEMRRNEFLQIMANPTYLQIVGIEGIAEILREMAKTLGLGDNIIPSRIELRQQQKKAEQAQEQQRQEMMQLQQQKDMIGVEQVKMQVSQADLANQRNLQLKAEEMEQRGKVEQGKLILKAEELDTRRKESVDRATTALTKQQMQDAQRDRDTNKNIALSVTSGFRDKNNTT